MAAKQHDLEAGAIASVPALAKVARAGEVEDDEEHDEWMCPDCGRWFGSTGGLFQHRRQVHGLRGPMDFLRQRVIGSVCQRCPADFRTKERLFRHLMHSAAACHEDARLWPVLPPDIVEAAGAEVRRLGAA